MGRVYDVKEPGGRGVRALDGFGRVLLYVYRVELDEDADAGKATVYAYVTSGGTLVMDETGRDVARCSYRTEVRIVPKDDPAGAARPAGTIT